MYVRVDGDAVPVSVEAWLPQVEKLKGDQFFSTDYMLLYRLDVVDVGWRIVAKVFSTTPSGT